MSNFVEFNGYGVNAPKVSINPKRVTHFFKIDYNGNYGTEIVLDTGKTVRVSEWTIDVEKKLSEQQAGQDGKHSGSGGL